MPIRLIALDLDGTLLNSQHEIPPANREAIQAAAARGIEIVIVTGRRFYSARPFVEQLAEVATVISSNGARIGTMAGTTHYLNPLPQQAAQKVVETAHEYRGYAVVIFDQPGRGQLLMSNEAVPSGPLGWYTRNGVDGVLQVPELAPAITTDPLQIMFGGPQEEIEPIGNILESSAVRPFYHLTWTKYLARNFSLLDVMNRGCSKGIALAYWARRRNIRPQEIMAIGDNLNDREMLEFAGQPVLMANHNFDPIPDGWAVTLSNDADGVAAALRRYAQG
ncbi:MAG: Cof-type HAD-IIB family hydrolase [Terriglobia bacterium]